MIFQVNSDFIKAIAMKIGSDAALSIACPDDVDRKFESHGVTFSIVSRKGEDRDATIFYNGRTVGIVKTYKGWKLPRFGSRDKYDAWKDQVVEYLQLQLTKLFVEVFANTDANVDIWKKYIPTYQDNVMSLSGYIFVGKANEIRNEFSVIGDFNELVYQIKKVNGIGMTTKQGYQNFNEKNIMSEFSRVLATLLQNDQEFKIPVELS